MAEITRKRLGELLRKLFEILLKHPEGLPAAEVLKRLAESVTLSPYEAGFYDSGSRRFEKIVRFATVDCSKAGWMLKNKGTWSLSETGIQAFKTFKEPEVFYKEAVRLYRQWKASRDFEAEESTAEPSSDSEKATSITFEEAEEQAWAEIEQFLGRTNPYDFQKIVADLLKAMGYHVSWIAPQGKDGGVDIIAHSDPLGTKSPRIKVQVKRQQQKVDTAGLKSFLAIVNEDDVGLFVATGGFTRDAEDFARSQERRKITLIDLEKLIELWTQFSSKLDDQARQRLPLTPVYFLTPST